MHRGEPGVLQDFQDVLGRAALFVVRGHHADIRGAELWVFRAVGAAGGYAGQRRRGTAAVQRAADGVHREFRTDGGVAHGGEAAV